MIGVVLLIGILLFAYSIKLRQTHVSARAQRPFHTASTPVGLSSISHVSDQRSSSCVYLRPHAISGSCQFVLLYLLVVLVNLAKNVIILYVPPLLRDGGGSIWMRCARIRCRRSGLAPHHPGRSFVRLTDTV